MQHMWCTAGGLEHVYVQQAVQWCQLATQQYSWLRLLACTVTLTLAGEWLTGAGSCAAPAPAPSPWGGGKSTGFEMDTCHLHDRFQALMCRQKVNLMFNHTRPGTCVLYCTDDRWCCRLLSVMNGSSPRHSATT